MRTSTYTRTESTETYTDHRSRYWRGQAQRLFSERPDIHTVEVVHTGRKTDSTLLPKGSRLPDKGVAVIVGATGGRWGKSRKNFLPLP